MAHQLSTLPLQFNIYSSVRFLFSFFCQGWGGGERFIGNSFFCFCCCIAQQCGFIFYRPNAVMANNVTIKVAIRDVEIGKSLAKIIKIMK